MRIKRCTRGFTLLELLVAIAIMALLALGSYRLLSGSIAAREANMRQAGVLLDMQKALAFFQRDLEQATDRAIRDELGDSKAAFSMTDNTAIEWSRRGLRNPLQAPRSDIVRLRYRLENGRLLRERWLVVDRARDSKPEVSVLLEGIQSLSFQVNSGTQWSTQWPEPVTTGAPNLQALPKAVEIRFIRPPYGEIRRIILLPTPQKPSTSSTSRSGGSDVN